MRGAREFGIAGLRHIDLDAVGVDLHLDLAGTRVRAALESALKIGAPEASHAIESAVEHILEACTRFSVAVREIS